MTLYLPQGGEENPPWLRHWILCVRDRSLNICIEGWDASNDDLSCKT